MSASIILAHNHPSGNINASQSDIDLTRKLMKGGELLDITVLDHLIMTPTFNKYSSFADSGLVF
jgi:DNA repair protein RadC